MKAAHLVLCLAVLIIGCEGGSYTPPLGLVTHQQITYSDGLHNENTEMINLSDRILLIFRGGETAQIGSDRAHINVYGSTDGGKTFAKQSEVSAAALPGMRDIRDPKLVEMNGTLYLYAISRLPGGHYRDLLGQAWTVRAESKDSGMTWSDPVKTFSDVAPSGAETYWGFWRYTKRTYLNDGVPATKLYALGYDDGDIDVGMFSSDDGITWRKESIVVSSYADVPSEAELKFFGDAQQTAVALVRMDNQGILQDGQSAICTSQAPFASWECGRRIEQRLDGPTWIEHELDGVTRHFVVARKHLPCTAKRTALYELRGNLADPAAHIQVCELQELTSAGDTAYTALASLGGDRYLTSWYSTPVPATGDIPWLEGTYLPSDIWTAELDFSRVPSECNAPPKKRACQAPSIPSGKRGLQSGDYLLAISPVIYPSQLLSFRTTVSVHADKLDLSMQPLDAKTLETVGMPWVVTDVPVSSGGRFDANLDGQSVPGAAFPLLDDPFLTLYSLHLVGTMTSSGTLCGNVEGYAQTLGTEAADRIQLPGSTFGAVPITGATLPTAVGSCVAP
ncbi:MAG: sialidase family protein [Polyangia bacterium]